MIPFSFVSHMSKTILRKEKSCLKSVFVNMLLN